MPRVLVVDDDADIRDIIQMNLESAGYEVVTAANGAEALDAVKRRVPDAMFLDVMMPGVDGWTVLERLKAAAEIDISRIPVFMVTGMTERDHRLRGGIEGALQYITKPFDPLQLVDALEAVLAPDSPSEPELRRQVQAASLEALARVERLGDDTADVPAVEPRVRLTRLENTPVAQTAAPRLRTARDRVAQLTPKQRELLELLATGRPVTAVAADLEVSRSNIYASLRRIGRKLGLQGTDELLALLRQGGLLETR